MISNHHLKLFKKLNIYFQAFFFTKNEFWTTVIAVICVYLMVNERILGEKLLFKRNHLLLVLEHDREPKLLAAQSRPLLSLDESSFAED